MHIRGVTFTTFLIFLAGIESHTNRFTAAITITQRRHPSRDPVVYDELHVHTPQGAQIFQARSSNRHPCVTPITLSPTAANHLDFNLASGGHVKPYTLPLDASGYRA
jgi:hypothetical protein